jgi:hypothetical protein
MRRYNQFSQLDADIRKKHPKIPTLPGKTFLKLSASVDLDKRRIELHNYLRDLANRGDMRTNPAFRSFLELDEHIPDSVCYSPLKVGQLTNLFFGGRDVLYLPEEKTMLVAQSKMNIASRVDSYFNNVTFFLPQFSLPWDSSDDNVSPVGALSVFKVVVDVNDEWQFQLQWTCSYTAQTNILYYCN